MHALASDLRKALENTVVDARDKAERGARDALTALAVGASEPFSSMSDEERKLRNRLRAHGRQLGDQRDPQKGTQSIERLVREMAYEHWHRMLFARFLAENQLLIEPTSGVSISLDECEELAAEEGTDLWGLAAQFAQEMLPQIFRVDDPVLAAKLPLEIRQQLQGLVAGLEVEVFTASDSLGWVYQFWQKAEKDEVNERVKSGEKINADTLPSVTQLFTEDYMVKYLLHNAIGGWLVNRGSPAVSRQEDSDHTCFYSIDDYPLSYLWIEHQASDLSSAAQHSTPLAGDSSNWPNVAKDFRFLDPCCGSGHFLVEAFQMLWRIRRKEEKLDKADAIFLTLESNIYGLEIDSRCSQIAAFNVALAAWKEVGHFFRLPRLNISCSGLAPQCSREQWLELADDAIQDWDDLTVSEGARIANSLSELYSQFANAPEIGSLLDVQQGEADLFTAEHSAVRPFIDRVLSSLPDSPDLRELSIAASSIQSAAEILSGRYTYIATNVPYLGRKSQSRILTEYADKYYPESSKDLSTIFLERMLRLVEKAGGGSCGAVGVVIPQNWLFTRAYRPFRELLLSKAKIESIAKLGAKGFRTPMWDFNVMLMIISPGPADKNHAIHGIDAMNKSTPEAKAMALHSFYKSTIERAENDMTVEVHTVLQSNIPGNPDSIISFDLVEDACDLLEKHATCLKGASAGDLARFSAKFWEICHSRLGDEWQFYQESPKAIGKPFTGRTDCILWQNEKGEMYQYAQSVKHLNHAAQNWLRGKPNWGKQGVVVGLMAEIPAALYTGEIYDSNCCAIIPNDPSNLLALWAFFSTGSYQSELRKLNQALAVGSNFALLKVPFDIAHWSEVAQNMFPGGLPEPSSDDPTQWLFPGHPNCTEDSSALQVATCRLIGYKWPSEIVPGMRLSQDARAWQIRCGELAALADVDGIVCLSPVRGEASAVERLRKLLSTAYGDEWSAAKERELLLAAAIGSNAKKSEPDIESWLRNSFFAEHCKLFQSRPFIWQVWDGNPHGFSALVNYHKLAAPSGEGRKTLEQLTFTYLGDWIDRQKLDQAEGINGADDRLAAALDLQGQLKKILEGDPPYDLFVRWKPLHQQPIGWDPDFKDGVRLNIRPFVNSQLRKGGKAGAGILRSKPGAIKWTKDRGKEPFGSQDVFPWFWGWDENDPTLATDFGAPITGAPPAGDSFDGNRWNDLHYTRAAKEAARARHRGDS
jgi:hypothetical protein